MVVAWWIVAFLLSVFSCMLVCFLWSLALNINNNALPKEGDDVSDEDMRLTSPGECGEGVMLSVTSAVETPFLASCLPYLPPVLLSYLIFVQFCIFS